MFNSGPALVFQSDTALMIVDPQNCFCPGGSLAVVEGDQVMAPLNRMILHAMQNNWAIMISRDWHPPVTKHFALYGGKWPEHAVQYTRGAEFHRDLQVPGASAYRWLYIITKGEGTIDDGYSAFDGHHFGTSLNDRLVQLKVRKMYIGGLATDYCVKATALDAVKYGQQAILLEDACRAVNINPSDGEDALVEMETAGVVISSTDEVLEGGVS